ncbi:MAG: hypothetical protein ABSA65_16045 [Acidimicrobiales bacterium]|jgi:hypothetical protein
MSDALSVQVGYPNPANSRQPSGRTAPRVARVVSVLGLNEAKRLARNPTVLAGLLGAVAVVVVQHRDSVPRWWVADVQLGTALLFVGVATLLAAHLAASRVRRDNMAALYESYPASQSVRTASQLFALIAPLALSAVLVALSAIWFVAEGVVGEPRAFVLIGALALVALLGVFGVLLGSWAPAGWIGILAAALVGLVEVVFAGPSYAPAHLASAWSWWLPWSQPDVLPSLPGPVSGVPPAGAHLVELIGLAAVLGVVALLAGRPPRRRLIAAVLVACLAGGAAGWSGWEGYRPAPVATLDRLVASVIHPAAVERCANRGGATYCAYPEYLPWVVRWDIPVGGVLAHLPRPRARVLVVRQVANSDFLCSPALTGAGVCTGAAPTSSRARQVERLNGLLAGFQDRLATDPHLVAGSSDPPVYVGLGWASGAALGPYQLNLALATSYWAVGLPTTSVAVPRQPGLQDLSCLPVAQAREAVAVWLATTSTPGAGQLLRSEANDALLIGLTPYGSSKHLVVTDVVGLSSSDIPMSDFVTTRTATLLGLAMARLPPGRVELVLGANWAHWLDWRTSDATLATALGLDLPAAPVGSLTKGQVASLAVTPAVPVCH